MIKKSIGIILAAITLIGSLAGCGATQTQVINYDPYAFTPRDFYEEGGWDAAKSLINDRLSQIYCEANDIVIDGGVYEPVLTVSGTTYQFDEARILTALYVHNVPEVNTDKETQTLNNWLDVAIEIPIKEEEDRYSTFVVRMKNITRTEDGVYTCISVGGLISSAPWYMLTKEVELNSYYVVNDGEVKEPLDYGVLEWIEDEQDYDDAGVYAIELEEARIEAYLLALEKNNSLYFTTAEYQACDTANYTTDYNAENIIDDLNHFTQSFGMTTVDFEDLPRKKNGNLDTKAIKKEGWTENQYSYTIADDAKTVQEFCRTIIRNQYFTATQSEFCFYTEQNEETGVIELIMWTRIAVPEEITE